MRNRYGLLPDRRLRIVEIEGGVLLVPLTDAPIGEELERELRQWQALGAESMEEFDHKDD